MKLTKTGWWLIFTVAGFTLLFTGNSWGADKVEVAGLEAKQEKEEPYSGFGPLDSRNNFPLQLMFLNFAPDRARVLPHKQIEVKFNGVYSNVANRGDSKRWDARMDMEVWRAGFQVRLGLWDRLELGIEIPYIYQWHGTFDDAINGFHRTFGLALRSRKFHKDNKYEFFIIKDDEVYVLGRNHNNGQGDIILDAKIQLLKEDKYIPAISVKPAIKIPTGDDARNLSSGRTDGGVSLLLEKNYKRIHFYLNAGVVFTGQNSRGANIKTHEIYHALVGLEYSLTRNLALNLQVVMNSSPLRRTQIKFLDRPGVEVDFGLKYRIHKNVILHLGMIQDLSTGAPDVSLLGGVKAVF